MKKVLVLFLLVISSGCSVAGSESKPKVLATATIEGKRFFGAAALPDAFFVVVDDTLYAYSASGIRRWQNREPWYEFRRRTDAEERYKTPNFNRPAPLATSSGVAVVSYKDGVLFLDAYDRTGKPAAMVKLLPHNMKLQQGLLSLGKAAHSIAFGYRLSPELAADNPDKGVLLFDESLNKLHEFGIWGDRLCCATDGSVYAPTERWGTDLKWAHLSPDGRVNLLPASVSRNTSVLQPGIGSQLILWSRRENSEGTRPDGARDTIGTRRIWQPSHPEASTIYESWGGWLGEVVPCPNSRYLLRSWPDSKQKVLCLNDKGKILWEHKLTLSCYFWPPSPLCAPDGTLYIMDTVRNADGQTNDVVLRCLTPSGEISWELKIDQTKTQPNFETYLSPSGSHMLLVRRDQGTPGAFFMGNPKLFFVDLSHRHPD